MKVRVIAPLFVFFVSMPFYASSCPESKTLVAIKDKVILAAHTDLQYASQFIDKNGQIWFGHSIVAMRGGEIDYRFTPKEINDAFWIHPTTGLVIASAPKRPIKAWHSGMISSYARASQHVLKNKKLFKTNAKAVADFFMNMFLTPKGYPYGTNQMWGAQGNMVTWEQFRDGVYIPWETHKHYENPETEHFIPSPITNFELFGIPWFVADRFGLVRVPWIARAGWADLDFLVEVFSTMYEIDSKPIYRKVAEDLAAAFWQYSQVNDPNRDYDFLVRTDQGVSPGYSQHPNNPAHNYFWAHDAEGAVYAYFKLANTFSKKSEIASRSKYATFGIRMADLWLEIMRKDPRIHAESSADPSRKGDPQAMTSDPSFPGWPPVWRYRLDYFKPDQAPQITPLFDSWERDTVDDSRSQSLGADFFRIDHVPHGLVFAFFESKNLQYLLAANHIAKWIWSQPNMDTKRVALKRIEDAKGHTNAHNIHSDSPYMRASLVLTHALLAKAWTLAQDTTLASMYKERALTGINALLADRFRMDALPGEFPLYSIDNLTFVNGEKISPVYLSDNIWKDPNYVAAPLFNELYGYVYDYLFQSIEILESISTPPK